MQHFNAAGSPEHVTVEALPVNMDDRKHVYNVDGDHLTVISGHETTAGSGNDLGFFCLGLTRFFCLLLQLLYYCSISRHMAGGVSLVLVFLVVAHRFRPFGVRHTTHTHTHPFYHWLGRHCACISVRPGLQPDANTQPCLRPGGATLSSSPHDHLLACLLLGVSLPRPKICLYNIHTSTLYAYSIFMFYCASH
jgi:hypothetical protein